MRALLLGGWLAGLIWWERRRALRPVADSKLKRDLRNLAVAATAGAAVQLLELLAAFYLALEASEKRRSRMPDSPSAYFMTRHSSQLGMTVWSDAGQIAAASALRIVLGIAEVSSSSSSRKVSSVSFTSF